MFVNNVSAPKRPTVLHISLLCSMISTDSGQSMNISWATRGPPELIETNLWLQCTDTHDAVLAVLRIFTFLAPVQRPLEIVSANPRGCRLLSTELVNTCDYQESQSRRIGVKSNWTLQPVADVFDIGGVFPNKNLCYIKNLDLDTRWLIIGYLYSMIYSRVKFHNYLFEHNIGSANSSKLNEADLWAKEIFRMNRDWIYTKLDNFSLPNDIAVFLTVVNPKMRKKISLLNPIYQFFDLWIQVLL